MTEPRKTRVYLEQSFVSCEAANFWDLLVKHCSKIAFVEQPPGATPTLLCTDIIQSTLNYIKSFGHWKKNPVTAALYLEAEQFCSEVY